MTDTTPLVDPADVCPRLTREIAARFAAVRPHPTPSNRVVQGYPTLHIAAQEQPPSGVEGVYPRWLLLAIVGASSLSLAISVATALVVARALAP